MEKTTIYHNPRCGKSRAALEILKQENQNVEIREYLKVPLNKVELKELVKKLAIKPSELVRTKEKLCKETYKSSEMTSAKWITAMAKHPILMERPIVVKGNQAVIARPPEKALEVI